MLDRLAARVDEAIEYEEPSESLVQWESLPSQVDPSNYLPASRADKKRAQIDHMVRGFSCLKLEDQSVVVDFCSGGGHLGLVLAAMFPTITVLCLDRNPRNCARVVQRKAEAGLTNVYARCGDITDLADFPFDVGVAIHACGWLTDYVQALCLRREAAYVLCSCCVGKVHHAPTNVKDLVFHPRSAVFQESFTEEEYRDFTSLADVEFTEIDDNLAHDQILRRKCKAWVEIDRNLWARSKGYECHLFQMPVWATPKNDIIIGKPPRQ